MRIGEKIKITAKNTTWTGIVDKENKKSWRLRLTNDNRKDEKWFPNMMKTDGRLV